MSKTNNLWKTTIQAALITLLALLFYLSTLAPTVLWGDDAELQRLAILGKTESGVRDYWLWNSAAHEFTKLPFGDMAWRVNLACAAFAALTIGVVFVIFRLLDCSVTAAWAGSMALAISHTFWLHAVRAEVYSLFLFILALIVLLLLAWRQNTTRYVLLGIGLLLAGLAFFAHLLVVTFIPAIAALVIGTKKRNAVWIYALAVVSMISGFLTYWTVSQSVYSQASLSSILTGLFEIKARDVLLWLGFLGYQFILLTPIGIFGLAQFWKTDRALFLFLGLAFLGNVIFTLSFHVSDQYVFYLPSYLIFVFWVGKGIDVLQKRFSSKASYFLVTLFIVTLLPLPIYRLAPAVLNQLNLSPLSVRTLPNRDNNLFFLYPPKHGYYGARLFGEAVMKSLPSNAAVLADWLPLQTLTYFQQVEGMRQDVLLAETGQDQLAWLLQQSQTRPVFIADNESYYNIPEITQKFEIKPFGMIFLLERKP